VKGRPEYTLIPSAGSHPFVAARIAQTCGGCLVWGPAWAGATGVSTDTRMLKPGQAFFALVGANHDAHHYLPQAAAAGAAILVVEHLDDWRPSRDVAVVQVADTERALLALASWHRRQLRGTVAAVTGSFGKSTVKSMLGAILSADADCTVAPASYNNRIGVALTLLAARQRDDFVVLELGTNHPGEIDELARAAQPALGLITGIGSVHLEGLGNLDGVREAKAELIPHINPSGTLILNADDTRCASLAARFSGSVLSFGCGVQASVRPEGVCPSGSGWMFSVGGQYFHLSVGGRHNVLNAAAAICAAQALGVSLGAAAEALLRYDLPGMRYERRQLGGVTFILDCYNSNPVAMKTALDSFMLEPHQGRRVVVCGDMLELGDSAAACHRDLGAYLASSGIGMLLAVGPLARHVLEGWRRSCNLSQRALHVESADDAWQPLWAHLEPGDAVLVKGSRGMQLETIAQRIAAHLDCHGREAA